MQITPRTPTTKNPPERFTGDVWLDPIASPHEEGQRMIVAKVRFAPGARTAWQRLAVAVTESGMVARLVGSHRGYVQRCADDRLVRRAGGDR
jgi:hypothetical protein